MRALQREQKGRAWLAWHIVALDRAKRLPKLSELIGDEPRKTRAQSQAEIEATFKQWRFAMAAAGSR